MICLRAAKVREPAGSKRYLISPDKKLGRLDQEWLYE